MTSLLVSAGYDEWLNQPISISKPLEITYDNYFKFDNSAANTTPIRDATEITNLTPPQTPPQQISQSNLYGQEETFDLNIGQQVDDAELCTIADNLESSDLYTPSYATTNNTLPSDVVLELQMVDELVRLRAQNLPNWTDDDCSLASNSTAGFSPRSDSSYNSSSRSSNEITTQLKIRSRNYSSTDKKYRKKEQNKNAANRYRQKKKAESEVIFEEERLLEETNKKLRVKHTDIKREIKYLKSLMRDLYRAKGIIP